MSGDPIRCGDKMIGWIERTGCDNYWTIATFRQGNDLDLFKELLEATLDEGDAALSALGCVNGLNLSAGEPPVAIRDFQMTSDTTVEFKEGPWA